MWIISSLFAAILATIGLIKVDRIVTARGVVVSQSPVLVVQPLETAIVREIDVHVGQKVQAGQVLARLDPTFATADLGALVAQVSSLQAEVSREQAESDSKPFTYTGLNPDLALQAAIFAQRQAEYNYKLQNYSAKVEELVSQIKRSNSDAEGYQDRLAVAKNVEKMRRDLEKLQVGSKLNTLGGDGQHRRDAARLRQRGADRSGGGAGIGGHGRRARRLRAELARRGITEACGSDRKAVRCARAITQGTTPSAIGGAAG